MNELAKNEQLFELLAAHAADSLATSPKSTDYAEDVLSAVDRARKLISEQKGSVKSLVLDWTDGAKPIIERLFGDPELRKEYSETIFPGVLGRARVIGGDIIAGAVISIDLIAEADLTPTAA